MSKQRFSFFKHRYSTTNKILPTQNIQSFASNRSPKSSRVLSKHVRTSSIDLYVLCRFANPKGANSAFFEINKISIDRRQFTAAPEDKRIAHASWKGERASSYSSSTPLFSREGRQPRGESGTEKRRRRLDLPIPRDVSTGGAQAWNKTHAGKDAARRCSTHEFIPCAARGFARPRPHMCVAGIISRNNRYMPSAPPTRCSTN